MIPTIGLMIGAYIVVRMLSLILRKGERGEPVVVKIFSALTIILTAICISDLLARGSGSWHSYP
jgi:branched-subunit amino acid transport protein